jgi:hypothetical protein
MKDTRQGAAAIVFLVYYACALAFILYCLFTRRPERYIFGVFTFAFIRFGANVASLGWAIHLYDDFNWLIASLILGAEGEPSSKSSLITGYFALIISILFCIVGYEKEKLGDSVFYPEIPKGRNRCLHRLSHISLWFEYSELDQHQHRRD